MAGDSDFFFFQTSALGPLTNNTTLEKLRKKVQLGPRLQKNKRNLQSVPALFPGVGEEVNCELTEQTLGRNGPDVLELDR